MPARAAHPPAWSIVYYRLGSGQVPAVQFLTDCPAKVRATMLAVLQAVADGPPTRGGIGGGYWQAMHGDMSGYHEVRVDGRNREHFRLFCILDRNGPGLPGPAIAVIAGLRKRFRTVISDQDYAWVRSLGNDYRHSNPRRIAE